MPTLVQTLVVTEKAVGNMVGQRNCLFAGPSWELSHPSWRMEDMESIDLGCMTTKLLKFIRSK